MSSLCDSLDLKLKKPLSKSDIDELIKVKDKQTKDNVFHCLASKKGRGIDAIIKRLIKNPNVEDLLNQKNKDLCKLYLKLFFFLEYQ